MLKQVIVWTTGMSLTFWLGWKVRGLPCCIAALDATRCSIRYPPFGSVKRDGSAGHGCWRKASGSSLVGCGALALEVIAGLMLLTLKDP